MSSFNKLVPVLAVVMMLSVQAARAGDFKEETSGVTVHTPEGWKPSEGKADPGVMKLSLEKGIIDLLHAWKDVLGRIAHGGRLGLEGHRDARRAQQADVVVAISDGEHALRPDAQFIQQVP